MTEIKFPSSTESWGVIDWALIPKKIKKSWLKILFDIFMNEVFGKEIIEYETEIIMMGKNGEYIDK